MPQHLGRVVGAVADRQCLAPCSPRSPPGSTWFEEPYHVDAYPLRPGDQLLLDTHGTTEMRDA
ncbi:MULTISPECIES: hypothetical protein [Streptomyces]|uniref:hypothetical protein n=1 Tax=Streptomyces TaxID=1883 RepID=UPI001677BDFD|nr:MULTISPECIES: hypothetical protein [Streptomyces]MBK3523686.1 hypothetical protein [Streptomyces sp. MBT70]